jgi:hypothetical protein
MEGEIIFCEFVRGKEEIKNKKDEYEKLSCSFKGCRNAYVFDENEFSVQYVNSVLHKEVIKTISNTDGGRFICCGENWPYFLLFDIYDNMNVIILEDFREIIQIEVINAQITSISASKKGLKIATAYANTVCIYCFNPLGVIYSRKIRTTQRKAPNDTSANKSSLVEKIVFLANGLLLVGDVHNILRVYENDFLIAKINCDPGQIYTHPTKSFWAVVNTRYELTGDIENSGTRFYLSTRKKGILEKKSFIKSHQKLVNFLRYRLLVL